jgi:hypothetical protein
MGQNYGYDDAYSVGATGITVVSGASTASTAIPNMNDGTRAKVVRLQVTGNVYVKFGLASVTATTNDMMLSPNFDVLVNCKQFSTIAYIQETTSAKLNITPLES